MEGDGGKGWGASGFVAVRHVSREGQSYQTPLQHPFAPFDCEAA